MVFLEIAEANRSSCTVYDVNVNVKNARYVVPAKAGTHAELPKSDMQGYRCIDRFLIRSMDSRLRGNDGVKAD
jgi:hypothetical protein